MTKTAKNVLLTIDNDYEVNFITKSRAKSSIFRNDIPLYRK